MLIASTAWGACDSVSSTLSALNAAIAAASAGDNVCLQDGTYDDFSDYASPITVTNTSGISGSEITIRPESVGGVTFTGTFHLNIGTDGSDTSGKYVIVRHFKWNNIDIPSTTIKVIDVYADNVRITNNSFSNIGGSGDSDGGTIIRPLSGADDLEIDYNSFDTWERLYPVWSRGYRTHFHHNYLTNPTNNTGHGLEMGCDSCWSTDLAQIIEYNHFYQVNGSWTVISNKQSSAIYSYNVFDRSEDFTLRGGEDNTVHGNFFLDCVGTSSTVRVYDAGNLIYNNYITGAGSSVAGIEINGDGANPGFYAAADNTSIINNTIRDGVSFGIAIGYCATSCTDPDTILLKNNYVEGSTGTLINRSNGTNITATTNLCNTFGTATDDSGGTYCNTTETSTRLTLTDIYRLTSSAIPYGTADGNVTIDIDGQARAGNLDIGADEYDAGAVSITMASIIAGAGFSEQIEPPPVDYGKTKIF